VKQVDFLFNKLLGDKPMLFPWRTRSWLLERVAIIAAIEHFTAVLGYWIVNDSQALDAAQADPQMLDLLRWHGAEEVEHRSVAFDVLTELRGGWFRRFHTMLVSAIAMYYLWRTGSRYLCKLDPTYDGPLPTLRDYRRAAKVGRLPKLRELVFAVPRYCRPGYHPSQEADTNVALRYLASSPAAIAAGYSPQTAS
jgi:predicted metal-dependent hydrolase